jgi:hypothetical protein
VISFVSDFPTSSSLKSNDVSDTLRRGYLETDDNFIVFSSPFIDRIMLEAIDSHSSGM